MYIILYDDDDSGKSDVVLTRYGIIIHDFLKALHIAREVDSWNLYNNIRVCRVTENYNVSTDCSY